MSSKYEFSKERFKAVEINEIKLQDYCVAQKWHVLPTTRMNENKDCAPVFVSEDCEVLPDFLIFSGKKTFWVEIKTAENAPLNKRRNCHVLGIKKNNYNDYLKVAKATGFDVVLLFVLQNKFILTGNILTLPKPWDCQCRNCAKGHEENCLAKDNENLVYWDIKCLNRNLVLENWYF